MASIKETCSCGATLEYNDSGEHAFIYIACRQAEFHRAHASCRLKFAKPSGQTVEGQEGVKS